MTKTIDYSNITIYKIIHKEDNENTNVYVGSTSNFLNRKYTHKSACCNCRDKKYNQKKYVFIRENGGWSEWSMVEVEKYPCNNKREAEEREEYWRRHFDAKLNTKKAYTTVEERLEREKYTQKIRYERNRLNILKKLSQRVFCECGTYVPKYNLSSHRKTKRHLNHLYSTNTT
jgi:predicted GIY-YIG superfamily endonuclease